MMRFVVCSVKLDMRRRGVVGRVLGRVAIEIAGKLCRKTPGSSSAALLLAGVAVAGTPVASSRERERNLASEPSS